MPKMKTHSGAAKRFKITGTGKVMRLRANRQHLFEHKSSRVTRRLYGEVEVAAVQRRARSSDCSAGELFSPDTDPQARPVRQRQEKRAQQQRQLCRVQ